MLWYCWLGIRNIIWHAKNWVMRCWHSYMSGRHVNSREVSFPVLEAQIPGLAQVSIWTVVIRLVNQQQQVVKGPSPAVMRPSRRARSYQKTTGRWDRQCNDGSAWLVIRPRGGRASCRPNYGRCRLVVFTTEWATIASSPPPTHQGPSVETNRLPHIIGNRSRIRENSLGLQTCWTWLQP